MTPERAQVEAVTTTVKGLVMEVQSHTGGRIDILNKALDSDIYILKQISELRVARAEASFMEPISMIYQDANYHVLRAYFYASPSLIGILATIWTVVRYVWSIVKWVLGIVEVIQTLKIDDLLGIYWPAFEEARRKFRLWVSELSEAIGWGVDGFLHLLHATQGFTDVLGGLMGKTFTWMDVQWMEKTGSLLEKTKGFTSQITTRPGDILEILFQGELRNNFRMSLKFGEETSIKFRDILSKAQRALEGLGGVADELIAIQEGMPEIIRKNIPQVIWSNLDYFTEIIGTQILPRLASVQSKLDLFDSVFNQNSNKISDLADKLAHPGTNLLGIDELSDYARQIEEGAIDDVSARLWNDQVNSDRDYMQADLDAFAIIDAAVTSPLPVLPFMDIESPQRGALHGIVVDHQETWFVGGYNSQY